MLKPYKELKVGDVINFSGMNSFKFEVTKIEYLCPYKCKVRITARTIGSGSEGTIERDGCEKVEVESCSHSLQLKEEKKGMSFNICSCCDAEPCICMFKMW